MAYLTHEEYRELGFDSTREFEALENRAELAIDLFIRHYYDFHDFDKDHKTRKKAVKLATAYQIQYLDSTGILTAEDKQTIASTTLGRTTVAYSSNNSSRAPGVIFVYPQYCDVELDSSFRNSIVKDGSDEYIVNKIIPVYEPFNRKVFCYEIEVM